MDIKKLTTILLVFLACALHAQITAAGGAVFYVSGELAGYNNATTIINPTYNKRNDQVTIRALVCKSGTTEPEMEYTFITSRTLVDAKAGSGTGETNQFHWCCQLIYIEYLQTITANSGITFTPN